MAEFYIEKAAQDTADHLLHFSSCAQLPPPADLIYLGSIASFDSAWKAGKGYYNAVSACPACADKYATH